MTCSAVATADLWDAPALPRVSGDQDAYLDQDMTDRGEAEINTALTTFWAGWLAHL